MNKPITVFDSQTPEYERAFQTFLDHTDQKDAARKWLTTFIARLPRRRLFVDAGAGEGKLTSWLVDSFQRTIAIEPSEHLRPALRKHCPTAEVQHRFILQASIAPRSADLVVSSHVLYYIAVEQWMEHAAAMAGWLADEGVLVVLLQNHDSDCMRMISHFRGKPWNLRAFADRFQAEHADAYQVEVSQIPSWIKTPDFPTACRVAEFILNTAPLPQPAGRAEMEAYIEQHFAYEGGYRFSCHQDCLQVRPLTTRGGDRSITTPRPRAEPQA